MATTSAPPKKNIASQELFKLELGGFVCFVLSYVVHANLKQSSYSFIPYRRACFISSFEYLLLLCAARLIALFDYIFGLTYRRNFYWIWRMGTLRHSGEQNVNFDPTCHYSLLRKSLNWLTWFQSSSKLRPGRTNITAPERLKRFN